jgi:hypothetical protein
MVIFTDVEWKRLIVRAIIGGIIWGLGFYYIRKGLNKRNFREKPEKKKTDFYWDAVYGSVAAFIIIIIRRIIIESLFKHIK